MEHKKHMFILATFLVVSLSIFSQNIVELNFDYDEISSYTASAGLGNILIIDQHKSLVVIGGVKLGVINNSTGKILIEFDDSILHAKFDSIITRNYTNQIALLSNEEHKLVNTCTRQPYIYDRFFRIPSSNLYACEIWTVVRELKNLNELVLIKTVAYFTEDLKLVELYEREGNEKSLLSSSCGGFFESKYDFYIKKAVPNDSDKFDFVHLKLKEGKFCIINELELFEKSPKPDFFPGRFFTKFTIGKYHFIYNETNFMKTTDLDTIGEFINFKLHENELIGLLEKVNDDQLVGLRLETKKNGTAMKIFLFKSDLYFNKVKILAEFSGINFTINSVKVFDNTIYIFFFDRKKNKYLLKTLSL